MPSNPNLIAQYTVSLKAAGRRRGVQTGGRAGFPASHQARVSSDEPLSSRRPWPIQISNSSWEEKMAGQMRLKTLQNDDRHNTNQVIQEASS
jgi:hypothetical protein